MEVSIFNERNVLLRIIKKYIIREGCEIINLCSSLFIQKIDNLTFKREIIEAINELHKYIDNKFSSVIDNMRNIIGISQYTYSISKHSMMKFFRVGIGIMKKSGHFYSLLNTYKPQI
jgi:hypothetical protein